MQGEEEVGGTQHSYCVVGEAQFSDPVGFLAIDNDRAPEINWSGLSLLNVNSLGG